MEQIWGWVAAILGGWILIVNGAEKVVAVWRGIKAPNDAQDSRLNNLEGRMTHVEHCLDTDKHRLDSLDDGNRATQRAILALLDHGIDGNNLEQMRHAKEELQNHLINRS